MFAAFYKRDTLLPYTPGTRDNRDPAFLRTLEPQSTARCTPGASSSALFLGGHGLTVFGKAARIDKGHGHGEHAKTVAPVLILKKSNALRCTRRASLQSPLTIDNRQLRTSSSAFRNLELQVIAAGSTDPVLPDLDGSHSAAPEDDRINSSSGAARDKVVSQVTLPTFGGLSPTASGGGLSGRRQKNRNCH